VSAATIQRTIGRVVERHVLKAWKGGADRQSPSPDETLAPSAVSGEPVRRIELGEPMALRRPEGGTDM
jgi:hypothetical protein